MRIRRVSEGVRCGDRRVLNDVKVNMYIRGNSAFQCDKYLIVNIV